MDVQSRSVSGFLDGQPGKPVCPSTRTMFGLRRESITHVGHVTNVDGGIPNPFDGRSFNSATVCGLPLQIDVILELADLRSAGGKNQILGADGIYDVVRRQTFGLECVGIEIHLHLALFAAVRVGNRGPGNGHQPGSDKVRAVVEELLLGKFLPDKASWRIGTVDALYVMTSGGVVPGGNWRN